jgi:hypothetical protein
MNSKYYPLIKIARQAALMKRRFTLPFKLMRSGFAKSESYYPDLPHKSRIRILGELLGHIFKYGSIEWHYFSYGFDVKGFRDKNEYLDDNVFLWKAGILNTVLPERDNSCILRDKRLFSDFLSIWGFDSPKIIGVLNGLNPEKELLNRLVSGKGDYFLKPLDGECGRGIFEVGISDNACFVNGVRTEWNDLTDAVLANIQGGEYLVQERVRQHSVLDSIYDKSINTVRLVTVYDKRDGEIVPLSAVLRIGAKGNVVDNWAAGGLAVGIEMNEGVLKEYGFYKYGKGTKTMTHPDSGAAFKGIAIPYWNVLVKKALDLHRHLLPLAIIGWDIAITPMGPLFIEGNDNMEISINQEADRGLRKELEKLLN